MNQYLRKIMPRSDRSASNTAPHGWEIDTVIRMRSFESAGQGRDALPDQIRRPLS
jgi:hypothetical protein